MAANVNDVTQAGALLHRDEMAAHGDAGYRGVHKREEAQGPHWHVAMQPDKRRQLDLTRKWAQPLEQAEQLKASIRAKVGTKSTVRPTIIRSISTLGRRCWKSTTAAVSCAWANEGVEVMRSRPWTSPYWLVCAWRFSASATICRRRCHVIPCVREFGGSPERPAVSGNLARRFDAFEPAYKPHMAPA